MQSPVAEAGQYSGARSVIALASAGPLPHIPIMHSDFSLFRERLAYACRARGMTHDRLCASIGLGSRRRVDEHAHKSNCTAGKEDGRGVGRRLAGKRGQHSERSGKPAWPQRGKPASFRARVTFARVFGCAQRKTAW